MKFLRSARWFLVPQVIITATCYIDQFIPDSSHRTPDGVLHCEWWLLPEIFGCLAVIVLSVVFAFVKAANED